MSEIEFKLLIRIPKYPVIIISADKLYSAFNIKQLAQSCIASIPVETEKTIKIIDSSGEEFWYSPEYYTLTPGFLFKKWTKNKIIETYNNSSNITESEQKYSTKSLSKKTPG